MISDDNLKHGSNGSVRRVELVDATVSARIHLAALKLCGVLTHRLCGRGMQRAAWNLAEAMDSTPETLLTFSTGARLQIALNDGYWVRLLCRSYRYEPEVAWIITHLREYNPYFLDCGANIGYWSAHTAATYPPGSVTAIEASSAVFRRLAENAKHNSGRFEVRRAALWGTAGETLDLVTHPRRHAGNSLVDRDHRSRDSKYSIEKVRTCTVDQVIEEIQIPETRPILIKLDVEGAEIQALKGASRTLKDRTVLLVYEDHGKDPSSEVTRYILHLGLRPYILTGKGLIPATMDQLRKLKSSTSTGYNLIAATQSSGDLIAS